MPVSLARRLSPGMAGPGCLDLPPVGLYEVERFLDFLLGMSRSVSHLR